MTNVLDTLYERGFIKQIVFEDELRQLLETQKLTFYVGFDPTADSLHVGHYIAIMGMAHMQKAGHRPIILLGGGTALIGDPSGRTDMRAMMSRETVAYNAQCFREQMGRFLSFEGENGAIIVDNSDWLSNLNYIEFLREIGVHFSVNKMLAAECFKTRLERGLSFMEFNYMLMQSYDFLMLFKKYGCRLQMGGNDQWSNMLMGADLIRRKEQEAAFAVTFTLLENSQGQKMGKTAKGAVWLDKNKTSPYEFFQYFRNIEDQKVEDCLKLLTFLPLEEINELTKYKDERINKAKEVLAYEVTKLIHGKEEADKALEEAKGAFGDGEKMPTQEVNAGLDTSIADLMVMTNLADSKSQARRLIEGGGVRINEEKVTSVNGVISDYTNDKEFIMHKGKKVHLKIVLR